MLKKEIMQAYRQSKQLKPLFQTTFQDCSPLIQQDSVNPVHNYPFCTLGVLNAEAEWGAQKGIAFVVEDNYLLTCASNCYSHQHGEYPNITFTINSNRKHDYDTYKVTKVFIPKQFKTFSQNRRIKYNYALLYIQGQHRLRDKYGILKIVTNKTYEVAQRFFQCAIKDKDMLQMIAQHSLSKGIIFSANGVPIITWNSENPSMGLFFNKYNALSHPWYNSISKWAKIWVYGLRYKRV